VLKIPTKASGSHYNIILSILQSFCMICIYSFAKSDFKMISVLYISLISPFVTAWQC